jgi:pyruvate dehydrogenase E1 component alpha subunit
MDVVAVAEATTRAVTRIRAGEGPQFLEYRTYRFRPHSMFDPELYRPKTEVEEWKKRDPIPAFVAQLRTEGWLTDADLARLEADTESEIVEGVRFADAAPWEPVEDLLKDVTTPRPA